MHTEIGVENPLANLRLVKNLFFLKGQLFILKAFKEILVTAPIDSRERVGRKIV